MFFFLLMALEKKKNKNKGFRSACYSIAQLDSVSDYIWSSLKAFILYILP